MHFGDCAEISFILGEFELEVDNDDNGVFIILISLTRLFNSSMREAFFDIESMTLSVFLVRSSLYKSSR
jgi:hypothetical protein